MRGNVSQQSNVVSVALKNGSLWVQVGFYMSKITLDMDISCYVSLNYISYNCHFPLRDRQKENLQYNLV